MQLPTRQLIQRGVGSASVPSNGEVGPKCWNRLREGAGLEAEGLASPPWGGFSVTFAEHYGLSGDPGGGGVVVYLVLRVEGCG